MNIEDKTIFAGAFDDPKILGVLIDQNVEKSNDGKRAKPFRFVDLINTILQQAGAPDLSGYVTDEQLAAAVAGLASQSDLVNLISLDELRAVTDMLATKIELGNEVAELSAGIENAVSQIVANAPMNYNNLSKIAARMAAYDVLLGSGADNDTIINNLTEVLAAFANAPEGLNIINELAKKLNVASLYAGLDATIPGMPADATAVAYISTALNNAVTYLTGEIAKKQNALVIDKTIITNSNNPVSGGAVAAGLALIAAAQPQIFKLPADVMNALSATPVNMFSINLEPNSHYVLDFRARAGCSGTGGIKIGCTYSGAATAFFRLFGAAANSAAFMSSNPTLNAAPSGVFGNVIGSTTFIDLNMGDIYTTDAGVLSFTFAPVTNGQTASVFALGSLIKLTKLLS